MRRLSRAEVMTPGLAPVMLASGSLKWAWLGTVVRFGAPACDKPPTAVPVPSHVFPTALSLVTAPPAPPPPAAVAMMTMELLWLR